MRTKTVHLVYTPLPSKDYILKEQIIIHMLYIAIIFEHQ